MRANGEIVCWTVKSKKQELSDILKEEYKMDPTKWFTTHDLFLKTTYNSNAIVGALNQFFKSGDVEKAWDLKKTRSNYKTMMTIWRWKNAKKKTETKIP